MKFHEIIKARRKALGMTQQDIADIWGISSVNVSDWERGNGMPESSRLPAMAKKLKVSISALFGEEVYSKDQIDSAYKPETRSVIAIMESTKTDERGRIKILSASQDAFDLHQAHTRKMHQVVSEAL